MVSDGLPPDFEHGVLHRLLDARRQIRSALLR